MAAYLDYTLRMKTLFRGWPVMVHDTHTRRRLDRKCCDDDDDDDIDDDDALKYNKLSYHKQVALCII